MGERIFGPRREEEPHGRAAEGRSVWNRHPLLPTHDLASLEPRQDFQQLPTHTLFIPLAVAGRASRQRPPEKRQETQLRSRVARRVYQRCEVRFLQSYCISFFQTQPKKEEKMLTHQTKRRTDRGYVYPCLTPSCRPQEHKSTLHR